MTSGKSPKTRGWRTGDAAHGRGLFFEGRCNRERPWWSPVATERAIARVSVHGGDTNVHEKNDPRPKQDPFAERRLFLGGSHKVQRTAGLEPADLLIREGMRKLRGFFFAVRMRQNHREHAAGREGL